MKILQNYQNCKNKKLTTFVKKLKNIFFSFYECQKKSAMKQEKILKNMQKHLQKMKKYQKKMFARLNYKTENEIVLLKHISSYFLRIFSC